MAPSQRKSKQDALQGASSPVAHSPTRMRRSSSSSSSSSASSTFSVESGLSSLPVTPDTCPATPLPTKSRKSASVTALSAPTTPLSLAAETSSPLEKCKSAPEAQKSSSKKKPSASSLQNAPTTPSNPSPARKARPQKAARKSSSAQTCPSPPSRSPSPASRTPLPAAELSPAAPQSPPSTTPCPSPNPEANTPQSSCRPRSGTGVKRAKPESADFAAHLARASVGICHEIECARTRNLEDIQQFLKKKVFSAADRDKLKKGHKKLAESCRRMDREFSVADAIKESPALGWTKESRIDISFTLSHKHNPISDRITPAKPDYFEGEDKNSFDDRLVDIQRDRTTKEQENFDEEEFRKIAVPHTHEPASVLTNFFIEFKAANGTETVCNRQAAHNGAIGAQIMRKARAFVGFNDSIQREGDAFAISGTCVNGTLTLYAATPVLPDRRTRGSGPPQDDGQNTGCHLDFLGSYLLSGSYENYLKGMAALRNASDWAQMQREAVLTALETGDAEASGSDLLHPCEDMALAVDVEVVVEVDVGVDVEVEEDVDKRPLHDLSPSFGLSLPQCLLSEPTTFAVLVGYGVIIMLLGTMGDMDFPATI